MRIPASDVLVDNWEDAHFVLLYIKSRDMFMRVYINEPDDYESDDTVDQTWLCGWDVAYIKDRYAECMELCDDVDNGNGQFDLVAKAPEAMKSAVIRAYAEFTGKPFELEDVCPLLLAMGMNDGSGDL